MHKVAITGLGIISCLGNTADTVTESLRTGASGIVVDNARLERGFRSPLTGVIRGFEPKIHLPKKNRKTIPDFGVWAYAACKDALAMAGMEPESLQNPESGLIFGCDSTCVAAVEQVDLLRERGETSRIGSGQIFRSMTSTVTMNLNTLLKTQGACWSLSSACSSGGHALGQAADLIALGKQERVLCGGVQEITWESMCSFDGLGAFSTRVDEPEAASRPFDRHRDGLVPSGGAAVVLLERYDLAKQRGATILGEIASYAFSSDGHNISVPSKEGLARAMQGALKTAGLCTKDIDCLCAHATSTPAGDLAEAMNIGAVFGDTTPPVCCLKGMTGHELWMSGASQVVYATLMAKNNFIAPNKHFSEADEQCAHLDVVNETREQAVRTILCNSAGFGGTNSCLILRIAP